MVGMAPALLAVGERIGATGRDLLEAFVVGNELSVALEAVTHTNLQNRGIHAIGGGRISVAAACSKLLGLDARRTAMAMGLATSTEGGLVSNQGTMTKPLHAGLIAKDGVMAALMVEKGFTGLDHVFDHPSGWYGASPSEGTADMVPVAEALGHPIRIQHTKYIRRFPCCRTNHGMLDSILGLMREHEFDYKDVESLDVDQSFLSVVMLYREPEDELKGKFSVLYNAASALVDGEVGIDTFTAEKIRDPRVQETMAKVNLNVRSRWDEGSSEVKGATPVRIRLKDGRVLEHATPRQDILGHQNNPWGMDGITGKFRVNARLALSDEAVERAVETWSDVARVEDVGEAVKTLVA
jgi:2-methylcitrate dehydratase PrpD